MVSRHEQPQISHVLRGHGQIPSYSAVTTSGILQVSSVILELSRPKTRHSQVLFSVHRQISQVSLCSRTITPGITLFRSNTQGETRTRTQRWIRAKRKEKKRI